MIEINDLIGKPFMDDPEHAYGPDGYSCYGLLWKVFLRYGYKLPKVNISVTACKQASDQEIQEQAAKDWQQIDAPEVPCGVLIQSVHPEYANHIGIYIGSGKMLHVTMNHNVEVSRVEDYRKKILGYFKYAGATV